MKNIYVYYLFQLFPILAFILWGIQLEKEWYLFWILFYLFPYRIILDTWRLLSLEVIEPEEIWVNMIPLVRFRYYRALFLGVDQKQKHSDAS